MAVVKSLKLARDKIDFSEKATVFQNCGHYIDLNVGVVFNTLDSMWLPDVVKIR